MGQDRQMSRLPPCDPGDETSGFSWESPVCGAEWERLFLTRALQHVLHGRGYFEGVREWNAFQVTKKIRWKVYTRAMTLIRAVALCWAWLCTDIKNYSICSRSFSSRNRIVLLDVLTSHLIAKTKMNTVSSFYLTLSWEDFSKALSRKQAVPMYATPPADLK